MTQGEEAIKRGCDNSSIGVGWQTKKENRFERISNLKRVRFAKVANKKKKAYDSQRKRI